MGDRSASGGGSSASERAGYQPASTDSRDRRQLQKPQLTMKDLVSFAYQSARGMEYLSTKMVQAVTFVTQILAYEADYQSSIR